jgi:hypothetical protein
MIVDLAPFVSVRWVLHDRESIRLTAHAASRHGQVGRNVMKRPPTTMMAMASSSISGGNAIT